MVRNTNFVKYAAPMTPQTRTEVASARDTAFVDALAQSSFIVMEVLTRVGAAHDLSLTHMRVLGILRDRRPWMAELADFLGLEKSTMSGLIDRAEQRGLVVRERSASDRRAVDVFMTKAGRELAARVEDDVRRGVAPAIVRLGVQQVDTLTKLLQQRIGRGWRSVVIGGVLPRIERLDRCCHDAIGSLTVFQAPEYVAPGAQPGAHPSWGARR